MEQPKPRYVLREKFGIIGLHPAFTTTTSEWSESLSLL